MYIIKTGNTEKIFLWRQNSILVIKIGQNKLSYNKFKFGSLTRFIGI